MDKLLTPKKSIKTFRIVFCEPTYFSTARSDNVVRLPIPELIFSNLLKLWNEFYDEKGRDDDWGAKPYHHIGNSSNECTGQVLGFY